MDKSILKNLPWRPGGYVVIMKSPNGDEESWDRMVTTHPGRPTLQQKIEWNACFPSDIEESDDILVAIRHVILINGKYRCDKVDITDDELAELLAEEEEWRRKKG